MSSLKDAVSAGWLNWERMVSDSDLKSLRRRRDFRKLVERMKRIVEQLSVQSATAFRRAYGWKRDGSKSVSGEGRRYLLSTVLGVTSGRGNSVAEVVACLRRAAAADGHPPQGTIYLMTNRDVRTKTRRWAFAGTARLLAERGVKAEIVQGSLPNGRRDIAGLMAGIAEFNMQKSDCLILPGAICEHLTSSGGVMRRGAGQTPLTEFIRHGAAGSCGTVMEPFAIQQKFPVAFLHVHYAAGCSLAEAFYQSVSGPYQLLIVGDPLCQPWARPPDVTVKRLEPRQTLSGIVAIRPKASAGPDRRIDRFELFVDGRWVQTCAPKVSIKLDTRQLADGYHELRVVAVCDDAVATRGRVIVPVTVDNSGRQLE